MWMQDHGASHAIIHHNRATIEGEMATGMLEQLYIEWGGYCVKTLQFEYSSMGKSPFFTFLVKLWTPEKNFILQKKRVGETRGKPLKLVFGYVCDFKLNCCGAVFFPDPNCVQKEPAPVHPATLRYRHHCIHVSLPRSSSLYCLICRTFLWKQSFVWDHWTFILIFFATWSKQSIVVAQPLLHPQSRTTSGSHQVIEFWNKAWSTWWYSRGHLICKPLKLVLVYIHINFYEALRMKHFCSWHKGLWHPKDCISLILGPVRCVQITITPCITVFLQLILLKHDKEVSVLHLLKD